MANQEKITELLGDGLFYHGPNVMVAPHLPVGSPERAALFAELRKTADADWQAAEEAAERERIVGYCDDCRSMTPPQDRLLSEKWRSE